MTVECNLEADLVTELKARLESEGYDVPNDDPSAVVRWWFTVRARSIPRWKRTVVYSAELAQRDLPPEERDSIRRIGKFARKGMNLNHFLSRRRLVANFTDALFVSWKILHFHLGPPSGGMVAGTSRLLFARVEPNRIYFIDVLDHKSFSEQDLLHTVESNWPKLNAGAHLKGVVGVTHQASNAEIAMLRAAGINVITQVGSRVFGPIGGGLATDRSSAAATMDAITLTKQVRELERQFLEEPMRVAAFLGVPVGALPPTLRFKLLVSGDCVRVRELTTATTIAEWTIRRTG